MPTSNLPRRAITNSARFCIMRLEADSLTCCLPGNNIIIAGRKVTLKTKAIITPMATMLPRSPKWRRVGKVHAHESNGSRYAGQQHRLQVDSNTVNHGRLVVLYLSV
eukprot:UN14643